MSGPDKRPVKDGRTHRLDQNLIYSVFRVPSFLQNVIKESPYLHPPLLTMKNTPGTTGRDEGLLSFLSY